MFYTSWVWKVNNPPKDAKYNFGAYIGGVHESSSFKNLGGLLAGLSFERRQYP
jgi:hypothetical protein